MITFDAAQVAIEQTGYFDAKNLTLLPIQQTPVNEIFNTIGTRYANNVGGNEYKPDATLIEFQSGGSRDTLCQDNLCTAIMNEMSTDIYREAARHLAIVKGTVVEVIKLVGASIQAHIDRIPVNQIQELKIIEKQLPEPIYELEDDIRKFDGTAYTAIPNRIAIGRWDAEKITQSLLVGSEDVDSGIKAWAATLGEEQIVCIWNSAFSMESIEKNIDAWLRDPIYSTDAACLYYLASSRFMEDVPEDLNVNLSDYRKFMTTLMSQSASCLNHALADEAQAIKSGRLVYNNVGNTITVNKRFYKEWLENGGNVEVIYGNSLIDVPYFYESDITANATNLIDIWRKHVRMIATGDHERKAYLAKDCIIDAIDDVVVANFSMCFGHLTEQPEINQDNQHYIEYKRRLDQKIRSFNFDEYSANPWQVTIDLCLDCIFPEIDCARSILHGITVASKENPTLSAEECQYVSFMMYICDFLCEQISVS